MKTTLGTELVRGKGTVFLKLLFQVKIMIIEN